jgi:chromosome segregation ATPase
MDDPFDQRLSALERRVAALEAYNRTTEDAASSALERLREARAERERLKLEREQANASSAPPTAD